MPSPLEVGRKVIFDEELIYTCHLMSPPLQIQKPCKQKSPMNCFWNVFVSSPILFHLEVVLWRDDVATASEGRTGSQRVFVIISNRILTSWKDCHHLNHATGALWFQHWHYHSHHYFCPHRYHSLLHHYSVIIVSSLLYHDDWMTLPLSSLLHHDNWMMSHLSSLLRSTWRRWRPSSSLWETLLPALEVNTNKHQLY